MRYAVTLVFEVGPGRVPLGPDVLGRMRLSDKATHRFSYCDGRTLTIVVDWSARFADEAVDSAVLGTRLVWSQVAGEDPGRPLSVRVRRLGLPRVAAGLRSREAVVEDVPLDDLLGPGRHEARRRRFRDPDDGEDGGGLAGVREPRRPLPGPGHLSAALEEPRPLVL